MSRAEYYILEIAVSHWDAWPHTLEPGANRKIK